MVHWGRRMTRPGSKTDWDDKAGRAIETARNLPPGAERHDAMKKAGLMRRMAALVEEINRRERPVRGKRSRKLKSERSGETAD